MEIEIPAWTSHYNQILYSLLEYCTENGIELKLSINRNIPMCGAILCVSNKISFLDYSDDFKFLEDVTSFDFYFKRSLSNKKSHHCNVYPLNFQINFANRPLNLLSKLPISFYKDARSRIEIFRAMDFLGIVTNDSHSSKRINEFKPTTTNVEKAKIIYMTRLWNPAKGIDENERERRIIQNDFRINACRIIRENFPNAIVGLFPDEFSQKNSPDLLLDIGSTSKSKYLATLNSCQIAIADDGLKNSVGWKIGEYALTGKAIITTPINVIIENFELGTNYLETKSRSDYECLPNLIQQLLNNDRWKEMSRSNLQWSKKNLQPISYVEKILRVMNIA